jgi:hypothetical protein
MTLTQFLGDSITHLIPLRWQGAAFTPESEWLLIFSAKADTADADDDAVIQKASGYGITPDGNVASVTLVPEDTANVTVKTLLWDIQAQHTVSGEVRTVATGNLRLSRDVTRETTPSVPIHTTEPPVPMGPPGPAPVITIGTVTTGAPGTPAAVEITGTAPNYTLNVTIPAGLDGEDGDDANITQANVEASITDKPAFLRSARINGKGSLADRPSKLWRLVARLQREQASAGSLTFAGRVRSAVFGDSVAADIGVPLATFFGFGGGDLNLQQWTRTGPTPTDGDGGGQYPLWSAGVFYHYDQWARTPGGFISYLDSAIPNGTTHTYASAGVLQVYHSVLVQFLTGTTTGAGDLNYGKFQLQYQINKTGSWLNAGASQIIGNTGSPKGYTVNGTFGTGATVITVTGGTGTIANGSTVVIGTTEYTVTTGITGSGNITLASPLTATVFTGYPIAPTVIDTNSGLAEELATAHFYLPKMDRYNFRLVATNGRVRMCKVIGNAGAWTGGSAGQGLLGGGGSVSFAQGGRSLDAHFSLISQAAMTSALSAIDPHVVIFKSANSYGLDYENDWPLFAAKVFTAAPNTTLVVCGSHPQNAAPTSADPANSAVDDYLRAWCAATPGAIFIDVRSSFPEYTTDNSADDLWSDGIHIYSGSSGNWGGGDWWITNLIWEALRPAFESALLGRNPWNWNVPLPMMCNEIRMYDWGGIESARSNKFSWVVKPRIASTITVRPADAVYNGGTQLFSSETGFAAAATDDTNSPCALYFLSNGSVVAAFGHHATLGSGYLGGMIGGSPSLSRCKAGFRFLAPPQNYGANPALVAEGIAGQAATTRIFGIDREATASVAGFALWSWFPDGSVQYEGTTADANQITFTYENPAADATIHTPVNATAGTGGTHTRVTAVVPSYATQVAGNAAVGVGEVFYAENVKKVFTRLS